jgi:hypothetical protein
MTMSDKQALDGMPLDNPQTRDEKILQLAQQRALLEQAAASGDPAKIAAGQKLQASYHAREMSGLAADVYQAAVNQGEPPFGYIRGSEHPDKLRNLGIDRTDAEIADLLHPKNSGFRAEIYLPDASVLGKDAKPVLTLRGTEPAILEDWLNNGRQSSGMESDYYNRAMKAAVVLNDALDKTGFEITGHSLGGSMGSAASAVTGARATTFNPSGLHENTAARYIQQQGLPQVYDTNKSVVAYQVDREMLTGGLTAIDGMTSANRAKAGYLAQTSAELSRLPGLENIVSAQLQKQLPSYARRSADEFVEHLASHNGDKLLRDVPTATGVIMPTLSAKMRDKNGELIDRPYVMRLDDAGELARPLADAMRISLLSAKAGQSMGETTATAGRNASGVLDRMGDAQENLLSARGNASEQALTHAGRGVGATMRASSDSVANARELAGDAKAKIDDVQGAVQSGALSFLSDRLRDVNLDGLAERADVLAKRARTENAEEAKQARADALNDARGIRQAADRTADTVEATTAGVGAVLKQHDVQIGKTYNLSTDAVGESVRTTTQYAPTAGALSGLAVGGVHGAVLGAAKPEDVSDALRFLTQGLPAAPEAANRHKMIDSVIPSVDFNIQEQERALLKSLQIQKQPDAKQIDGSVGALNQTPAIKLSQPGANTDSEQTPTIEVPKPNQSQPPEVSAPIGPPIAAVNASDRDDKRDDKQVVGVATGLQLGNDFREKGHPGNAAYEKMLNEVQRMETTNGIAHGPNSELVAAALLVKAEQSKFRTAEIVRMEPDGMVSTLKLSLDSPTPKLSVDPKDVVAQGQSFEKSTQLWAQARSPHYASDAPAAERTQEQVKALAQMTPDDRGIFDKIRENVPPHISDDVVAKAMLQAKKDDVLSADKIDTVAMAGDSITVRGQTAVKRSVTDVSEPAAPMADTVKQTESFNQQLAIDLRLQQEQALAKKQEQENQGASPQLPGGPAKPGGSSIS